MGEQMEKGREERNSVVCVSMQTYFVTNHLLFYSHNHSSSSVKAQHKAQTVM